ncbi:CyP450 monooxygenase [Obba rivulosa]|uniref:CyP450 monooxygenase n=1 Tax=Obba rivulosa TaxID=1052685 RepID=A0A8E2DMQ2_9APHY|nr:CyP450 monooxygenase [Obba rivulosa]
MGLSILLPVACLVLVILWKYVLRRVRFGSLPLPPGPKSLPIVGNIQDVPATHPWKTYAEWSQKYGDIIHLKIFRQHMVILNSWSDVSNLLEKRSANYSSRIHLEMINLMGLDFVFGVMPYGPRWRKHRRAFHEHFNQMAVHVYKAQYLHAAQKMLRYLYREPGDFIHWIRHATGSLTVSVVYGNEIADKDDEYVALAEHCLQGFSEAANPGAFWVDFFPLLKYVPAWMPGAGFQRKAAVHKKCNDLMKESAWKNMVRDGPSLPVAAQLAERISQLEGDARVEEEKVAKNVCAAAYSAGVDTTLSILKSFVLAMAMHPEVQRRAQNELDSVVGPDRLPDLSYRSSLPYIDAIVKESLRWQPVISLGHAHVSIAEDEYKGYRIPRGSLILQNTWAILHDPVEYPDPEEFKPERFLKEGKLDPDRKDPATVAFGAGRRICPGRHFSDLWLFTSMASILHVFEISPALDETGKPVELAPRMASNFISHTSDFECIIEPRSKSAEALILS